MKLNSASPSDESRSLRFMRARAGFRGQRLCSTVPRTEGLQRSEGAPAWSIDGGRSEKANCYDHRLPKAGRGAGLRVRGTGHAADSIKRFLSAPVGLHCKRNSFRALLTLLGILHTPVLCKLTWKCSRFSPVIQYNA